MNTLVLIPGSSTLKYFHFVRGGRIPNVRGAVKEYRGIEASEKALRQIERALLEEGHSLGHSEGMDSPLVALRVFFGGTEFPKSEIVDSKTFGRLESMVPHSPIHLPAVLSLLNAVQRDVADAQIVLVFETSFFAKLPLRENSYALDEDELGAGRLQRFGFHGIFHQAAVDTVFRRRPRYAVEGSPRILSICLDRRSEVCSVVGRTPLTVTSGVTPLEGLPGEKMCGEIDPSLVLTLSQEFGWGPEEIDEVLTHRSGLLGMTGKDLTVAQILRSQDPTLSLAREVFRYRLLLAAGAGVAAMGRLDHVIFSGRYCNAGRFLEQWLVHRLMDMCRSKGTKPLVSYCRDTLEGILAAQAEETLRRFQWDKQYGMAHNSGRLTSVDSGLT